MLVTKRSRGNALLWVLFSVFVLMPAVFAGFQFLASYNGTGADYSETFSAIKSPVNVVALGGKLYVSDQGTNSISILSGNQLFKKISQSQAGVPFSPRGIYVQPANATSDEVIYIANNLGSLSVYAGGFKEHVGTTYLTTPIDVAKLGGYLYVLSYSTGQVTRISVEGYDYMGTYLGQGSTDIRLSSPTGLFADQVRKRFLIADQGNNRVKIFDENFTFVRSIGAGSTRNLVSPSSVTVDENGIIFVSDISLKAVLAYDYDNNFLGMVTESLEDPHGVYVAGGQLYVADSEAAQVRVYTYNLTAMVNSQNATPVEPAAPTDAGQVFQTLIKANKTLDEFESLKAFAAQYGIQVSEVTAAYGYSDRAYKELTSFDFESAKADSDKAYADAVASLNSLKDKLKGYYLGRAAEYAKELDGYMEFEQKYGVSLGLDDFSADISALFGFANAKQFESAQALLSGLESARARIDSARNSIFLLNSRNLTAKLDGAYAQVNAQFLLLEEFNLSDNNTQYYSARLSEANVSFRQAEAALGHADLAAFQSNLDNGSAVLANASVSLASATYAVNETIRLVSDSRRMASTISFGIFTPDVSLENVMLDSAQDIVKSEPGRALLLAQQAHGLISKKYAQVNASGNGVILALLASLVAIAVLAVMLEKFFEKLLGWKMGPLGGNSANGGGRAERAEKPQTNRKR